MHALRGRHRAGCVVCRQLVADRASRYPRYRRHRSRCPSHHVRFSTILASMIAADVDSGWHTCTSHSVALSPSRSFPHRLRISRLCQLTARWRNLNFAGQANLVLDRCNELDPRSNGSSERCQWRFTARRSTDRSIRRISIDLKRNLRSHTGMILPSAGSASSTLMAHRNLHPSQRAESNRLEPLAGAKTHSRCQAEQDRWAAWPAR